MPNSEASSSSHKAAASKVSFLFGYSSSRENGVGQVSSRPSHRETEAEFDRESVATTILSSLSRGKRDRELNFAQALRDRENLQKILERKVDLAVRGEGGAQQTLFRAEAQIKARNWEKRNRENFSKRSVKNLNLSDFDRNKRADEQTRLRETKLACMESWN